MKKTFLLIGMVVCFGALEAQEQQPVTHVTPVEVLAIPSLNEQLAKIEATRSAMARTSRSEAAKVQEELLTLTAQYREMLEKEINRPATGKTLEALKAELAFISAEPVPSSNR